MIYEYKRSQITTGVACIKTPASDRSLSQKTLLDRCDDDDRHVTMM